MKISSLTNRLCIGITLPYNYQCNYGLLKCIEAIGNEQIIYYGVYMSGELIINDENGVKFYTSEAFSSIGSIKHFFSTRIGGVSNSHYQSLNLGIYTNDKKEHITENINRLFNASYMSTERLVYLKQVHGDSFHVVDNENYLDIIGIEGDALITKTKGIAIGVFTADCVPVILADKSEGVIAVIHAGWKGTDQRIVKKVAEYLIKNMGSKQEDIYAAIGPSIRECCFEVGKEVAEKFTCKTLINGRWHVDLYKENYNQLIEAGIRNNSIDGGHLCTSCAKEKFYSYRRDNGDTGRLGTFIQII